MLFKLPTCGQVGGWSGLSFCNLQNVLCIVFALYGRLSPFGMRGLCFSFLNADF